MKQQRISAKEAVRVAEDMAKPGPIRVVAASEPVAASEAQEAPGALVPSPGSELDRKMPPRVERGVVRNDTRTSAGGVTPSAGAICFAWG